MIKDIQKKFIMTAMIAITILLVIIMGVINIANAYFSSRKVDETLNMLVASEGNYITVGNFKEEGFIFDFYRPRSQLDVFLSSNFFVVKFDKNGSVYYVDVTRVPSIDSDEAINIAHDNFTPSGRGRTNSYAYVYTNTGFSNNTYAIFLDTTEEISNIIRVLFLSLVVGIAGWILMFIVVCLLSKRMIKPIAENISKQKEFITNAGHELKTPLAIIQSNTEALEIFNGESKYTSNIKSQTKRLADLMNNLLTLAKMQEAKKVKYVDINISSLLIETVQSYKDSYILKGYSINENIEENIIYKGDIESFKTLFNIFLDNGLKYTKSNFNIELAKKDKKIFLKFTNDTDEVFDKDLNKLFERFYRADESHNQKSGGYGIGLAMAKDIVETYKGDIKAISIDNTISFQITLKS